jgi:hypothetical protein
VPAADPSTKNPSRFSRLPGVVRPDTGKEQQLLFVGTRIKLEELEAKLPVLQEFTAVCPAVQHNDAYLQTIILSAINNPAQMMADKNIGSRNQFMYWLGRRLDDASLPHEQRAKLVGLAYTNLKDTSDFSFEEACQAARVRL